MCVILSTLLGIIKKFIICPSCCGSLLPAAIKLEESPEQTQRKREREREWKEQHQLVLQPSALAINL